MTQTIQGYCILATLILLINCGSPLTTGEQQLQQLEWIIGRWETTGEQIIGELWILNKEGGVFGHGYAIEEGDTSFFETLSIVVRGDDVYYVADVPHNPKPINFKLSSIDKGFVEFQNAEHDFPQRIAYQLQDGNSVVVTVEGVIDGQPTVQVLEFNKVQDN